MISFTTTSICNDHDRFIAMLPVIEQQARLAFRSADPESREEMTAEVVANSYCAYQRLVERGKQDVVHPTPLSRYAIRQVRAGRRVGTKLNARDVMSPANRRVLIESIDKFDWQDDQWKEVLVEDRHVGPAETVAARIDVAAWVRALGCTKRRIAKLLAKGETTSAAARVFGLSSGRISQLRQELSDSWMEFQGDLADDDAPIPALT